jgi:hypothetical protein
MLRANIVLWDETASEESKRAAVEIAEKAKLQLRQDGALSASALVEQNIQKAAQLVWMSSL